MKHIPLEDVLTKVALSPNVVSRVPIFETYDKNVQGNTFVERGQAAASVIVPFMDFPELPQDKKTIGVAVGTGGNPNVAKIDAHAAAARGICEAALQTACVGGEWLGVTDCLNFGNPEKAEQMGLFVAGVEGVKQACSALEIPIVSGNVSLYNESDGHSIPPSALVSVFAKVTDIKTIKPSHWDKADLFIYQLGSASSALGGSEFSRLFDLDSTELPVLEYEAVQAMADQLRDLVKNNAVRALVPLGAGGVWGTLVGAAMRSQAGFVLDLPEQTLVSDLLAETLGVLVLSSEALPGLKLLGKTQGALKATIQTDSQAHEIDLSELQPEFDSQLRAVF